MIFLKKFSAFQCIPSFHFLVFSRWNMDVAKGVRKIYKRLELLLLDTPRSAPTIIETPESSEMKHYQNISTYGTSFTLRTKPYCPSTDNESQKQIRRRSFGDVMDNFVSEEMLRPSQGSCLVCECPSKVRNNTFRYFI